MAVVCLGLLKCRQVQNSGRRTKKANPKPSASDALKRLNDVQKGLGFATTSKIAYFCGLEFDEGPALTYDKNVIDAIRNDVDCGNFKNTRFHLGKGKAFYHRGVTSYGSHIQEAKQLADRWKVCPDQIEAALFRSRVSERSGWSSS